MGRHQIKVILCHLFFILCISTLGAAWEWPWQKSVSKINCGQTTVSVKKEPPKKVILKDNLNEQIVLVNAKPQHIVNGNEAKPHSWPWMASIMRLQDDGSYEHYCGGVLITEKTVLTAAHCLIGGLTANNYKVRLGAHYREANDDDKSTQGVFDVDKYKVHGSYSTKKSHTSENDIAMIILSKKVDYSDTIRPTCVAQPGQLTVNSTCVVTGWGFTENFGSLSNTLQQLELPILDNSTCKASVQDGKYNATTQFCAGYLKGGKDSCQGDSGGPVVCKNDVNDFWRLEGLVSYGGLCAKGKPAMYTRVVTYREWILKNMPCSGIVFCLL